MVVHTQSERARVAQQAVVEFLLINHPLDCPVCDKGGECPLQDITFGWGGGRSRFIEPKRHFRKPLELSPLIAIDRERCILCYRCVRYSQEISEDYQLILLERGAHSFVGTFDGHPYVAPFSGNIIELCPVGALTSRPYRFRARPWEIEGAGTLCTLCPAQCNVTLTVRDERVLRVLARQHDEVDDGWLCDKGRFAYQAIHVDERITDADDPRRRRAARRSAGSARSTEAAAGAAPRRRAHRRARRRRRDATRRACCSARLMRDALGSPHLDSRAGGAVRARRVARAAAPGAARRRVSDLEFAHAVLVLDCEPRRRRADPRAADPQGRAPQRRRSSPSRATARARSTRARRTLRFAPGRGAELAAALAARAARRATRRRSAAAAGADADDAARAGRGAARRRRGGRDPLRRAAARRRRRAALLALADALGLAAHDGAGLIGIPDAANGRGLREAGVLPNAGPGPRRAAARAAASTRRRSPPALASGELTALYLLGVDPLRDLPDRARVGGRARARDDRDRPRRVPHRRRCASTRPSSSRPSPPPRRRARSPTPTAACSGCARRSPARARSAPSGRSSPSSPRASAPTSASAQRRDGERRAVRGRPVLRAA